MADITFTIPSVLNQGGGEKGIKLSADSLQDAFAKIAQTMGDDFKRRVLEADGTPRSLINVYINGKNAKFSDGINTGLKDGDQIYILPAVAGGAQELSSKELDRFSRQVMLEDIGYEGQIKLKNAKVCVVGVGGLGNPITSRLAAMGIGTLRIVDRDVIELSNLHRQTMFDEDDVGTVKVEAASKKLKKLNPDCNIEALPISVNDYTALEVVEGCDVVIDALDSVNARYALNKACVKFGIPFVTGAAVGVSGQAFTIIPKETACYHCMFPDLDEDTMPTCSIEGVHPSILSIIGGIQVSEAVKVIMGKKPSLSERIMHVDLENLDFSSIKTFKVQECPVCGSGKTKQAPKEPLIVEELCGRNRGKRTFSITPTSTLDIDVKSIADAAKKRNLDVDDRSQMGLVLQNDNLTVSFMKKGSAIIVGSKDGAEAVSLYQELVKSR